MGLIKLEYVIRYSSQDEFFKAENLLKKPGYRPWLCSQENKSGYMEAEFHFETPSVIEYIDVGNLGSSMVEIQVGKSQFKKKTTYEPFLPSVLLLTRMDIKAGTDFNSVYMFNKRHFNQLLVDNKWDRIKVICIQPREEQMQFGLSFLCVRKLEVELVINDPTSVNTSNERPLKYLSKKSKLSSAFAAATSRAEKLFKASEHRRDLLCQKKKLVTSINLSSLPSTSPQATISSQPFTRPQMLASLLHARESIRLFKEIVLSFLTACFADDKLSKQPFYYMEQFEIQRHQALTYQEQANFMVCFSQFVKNTPVWEPNEHDYCYQSPPEITPEMMDENEALFASNEVTVKTEEVKKLAIRFGDDQSSTSKGATSSPPPVDQHQCPICGKKFSLEIIVEHASTCTDYCPAAEKERIAESHFLTGIKRTDKLQPCELCMMSFDDDELEDHKKKCPFLLKYNYK